MTSAGGNGKVVVGYLHPSEVAVPFHKSLINLFVWDLQHEARILGGGGHVTAFCGTGRIPEGRNILVRQFLDTQTAEWLFMVDADMGFMADTVERLIAAADPVERPVVGGLCYGQKVLGADAFNAPVVQTFATIYRYATMNDEVGFVPVADFPDDTVIPADATGAACLLIHRSALETMRAAEGDSWFKQVVVNNELAGEDISFCVRLRRAGIPLHIHTGVETTHQKPTQLRKPPPYIAEPTYVVIPGLDRHEMTGTIVEQVAAQCERVFLFDNGSDPPYVSHIDNVEVIPAAGVPLHAMWNHGLDLAAGLAQGGPHNVAVLNNDLEVPTDFLASLALGLRSRDDIAVAYPNHHGLDMPRGSLAITSGNGARTLSGWAFMLRGEWGFRFDEQFEWWYGDDDIQAQVEAAGKAVVCVGVEHRHLEPNKSTESSPQKRAMVRRDAKRFEAKWPEIAEVQRQAKIKQRQAAEMARVPA